jgi:DNA-directed RNA polymerase specialized sigma24 family protein
MEQKVRKFFLIFFGPISASLRVTIQSRILHMSERLTKVKAEVEDDDIKDGLLGTEQEQQDAIEKAFDRYAKSVAGFIRENVAPTLDDDEVASAVNDTFCALAKYVARGKFRADGALITLLFSMARLKGYDLLRRKTASRRFHRAEYVGDQSEREGGIGDDEFAAQVAKRLAAAPEIAVLWRTAADEGAANEIIRQFRLWISQLPRLQRKVAQALLTDFGDVTNREICDEIAKSGERPTEASVKSARKEITRKFKTIIETLERSRKS